MLSYSRSNSHGITSATAQLFKPNNATIVWIFGGMMSGRRMFHCYVPLPANSGLPISSRNASPTRS